MSIRLPFLDSSRLPVVSGGEGRKRDDAASSAAGSLSAATVAGATEDRAEPDAFPKIERLHELKQKGILTEEEFAARKKNLLDRL
jgi:Short C-terminal domain